MVPVALLPRSLGAEAPSSKRWVWDASRSPIPSSDGRHAPTPRRALPVSITAGPPRLHTPYRRAPSQHVHAFVTKTLSSFVARFPYKKTFVLLTCGIPPPPRHQCHCCQQLITLVAPRLLNPSNLYSSLHHSLLPSPDPPFAGKHAATAAAPWRHRATSSAPSRPQLWPQLDAR